MSVGLTISHKATQQDGQEDRGAFTGPGGHEKAPQVPRAGTGGRSDRIVIRKSDLL